MAYLLSCMAHERILLLLGKIRKFPGIIQIDLIKKSNIPQSKASNYLRAMQDKGWITATELRHNKHYAITEKGTEAFVILYFLVNNELPKGVSIIAIW